MEQLIEDWDYLLNDDSEIALQIKELVNDASYHYIHDFWSETPAETLASVDGDYLNELKPLLVKYSEDPEESFPGSVCHNETATRRSNPEAHPFASKQIVFEMSR